MVRGSSRRSAAFFRSLARFRDEARRRDAQSDRVTEETGTIVPNKRLVPAITVRTKPKKAYHVRASSLSSNYLVLFDGLHLLACPGPHSGGACSQARIGGLFACSRNQIQCRRDGRQGDEKRQGRFPCRR